MTEAVARAFNEGSTLIVEAGTGTGKSLAYLVPAALQALRRGERVVVSTDTIGLQEQLIEAGPVPYTIVRATQFYEFLGGIADAATVDGSVRLGPVAIQPMAAADVAAAVADAAVGAPVKGVVEVGGIHMGEPQRLPQVSELGDVLGGECPASSTPRSAAPIPLGGIGRGRVYLGCATLPPSPGANLT